MIASAYSDPETIIGAIFGGGCNASYMENCGSIAKLGGLPENLPMAINCEYGAFDNDRCVLPRTTYDKKIDKESPRPGEQTFEKMSAGMYIGEIFRQVLMDFHKRGLLFQNQDTSKLYKSFTIKTGFLVDFVEDSTPKLLHARDDFLQLLNITLTEPERIFCRRAAQLIATRGARLAACGIAAICRKKNISSGHVAADRLVAKNPRFKAQWAQALGEIFDWPRDRRQDPIIMTTAADGSGLGAAVISAMTLQRVERGDMTGLRPE
jgi:hexokinase